MSSPPDLPSTVSPTPELSAASQPPTDPLAAGLKALLDPTIQQTTSKLWDVHHSQQELSLELERLVSRVLAFPFPTPLAHSLTHSLMRGRAGGGGMLELQHYLETSDPPALKGTVVKLAATSRRLVAVNSSLQSIQTRVNKLYVQLSKQRVPPPTTS